MAYPLFLSYYIIVHIETGRKIYSYSLKKLYNVSGKCVLLLHLQKRKRLLGYDSSFTMQQGTMHFYELENKEQKTNRKERSFYWVFYFPGTPLNVLPSLWLGFQAKIWGNPFDVKNRKSFKLKTFFSFDDYDDDDACTHNVHVLPILLWNCERASDLGQLENPSYFYLFNILLTIFFLYWVHITLHCLMYSTLVRIICYGSPWIPAVYRTAVVALAWLATCAYVKSMQAAEKNCF